MAKKVTDTKVLSAVAKHFDRFQESEDFAEILNNFTSLCELLDIHPTHFVNFYPDLKVSVPRLGLIFQQKKSYKFKYKIKSDLIYRIKLFQSGEGGGGRRGIQQ